MVGPGLTRSEVMREPVAGVADLAVKLAVWDRAVFDPGLCSDDVSYQSGWMDSAHYRLLSDLRQLLPALGDAA